MNGRWHTREDVVGDLYRATGSVPVDEIHFVYGERPPPQIQAPIDDEMQIMFGDQVHANRVPDQMDKPDLKGIVSMLRMVEQSDDENRTPGPELKPSDIIYISKLNPNVSEFVPKSGSSRKTPIPETDNEKENEKPQFQAIETTAKVNKLENIDIQAGGDKNCDEKQLRCDKAQSKYDEKHPEGDYNKFKCDDDQTKPDEQLTNVVEKPPQHDVEIEKLHHKICEASQHDTFYHKREKNAAIATLLKLNSMKPIKLYTPEFFEKSKATDFKGADEDSPADADEVKIDENNIKALAREEILHEANLNGKKLEKTPKIEKPEDNSKIDENTAKEHVLPTINIGEELKTNDEVQQSIEKVTNWFNGVTHRPKVVKTPEPIFNTSQFAYKRKETISPASTASSCINKKIPKAVESYKPSAYAMQLREKFAARKKELEKKQVVNIWDKLDEELKERDKKALAKVVEDNNNI